LSISHIGHSLLPSSNHPIYLHNILHVPGLSKHLLSIQKLAHDNHAFVELHPSFFCIKDQETTSGRTHDDEYNTNRESWSREVFSADNALLQGQKGDVNYLIQHG
jgi:hypothetical protein